VHVVIDTREQTPWAFDARHVSEVSVATLRTGDYALAGDDGFAIERKSLDDFLGTISTGWERFQREVERMDGWPAKVVIVEADFMRCCFTSDTVGAVIAPTHRHPQLLPQFVCKRIAELSMRGVAVLFAGDAGCASALAVAIFRERLNTRVD
jgi:ERCC4-type nuclease